MIRIVNASHPRARPSPCQRRPPSTIKRQAFSFRNRMPDHLLIMRPWTLILRKICSRMALKARAFHATAAWAALLRMGSRPQLGCPSRCIVGYRKQHHSLSMTSRTFRMAGTIDCLGIYNKKSTMITQIRQTSSRAHRPWGPGSCASLIRGRLRILVAIRSDRWIISRRILQVCRRKTWKRSTWSSRSLRKSKQINSSI